jgi:hypothetical protein
MRIILDVATMYEEYDRSQQARQEVEFTMQGTLSLSVGISSVFRSWNILSWLESRFTGAMQPLKYANFR